MLSMSLETRALRFVSGLQHHHSLQLRIPNRRPDLDTWYDYRNPHIHSPDWVSLRFFKKAVNQARRNRPAQWAMSTLRRIVRYANVRKMSSGRGICEGITGCWLMPLLYDAADDSARTLRLVWALVNIKEPRDMPAR